MRELPVMLLILLATSCANTPGKLAAKAQQLEFTSDKAPKEMAACISIRWGEKSGGVATNFLSNGYTVEIAGFGTTEALASITEWEQGSYVSYAERLPALSPAWMEQYVLDCK